MPYPAPIPRFLLPQGSSKWRIRLFSIRSPVHHASANKALKTQGAVTPKKPLVLEKPLKFNPPSHGARIRKPSPRYYGPDLTMEEQVRHKTKRYPNMFPPKGSFMYWFLTNKSIHVIITLGFLTVLTLSVTINNFKRNSPVAEMLPHYTHFFIHPIQSWHTVMEMLRMHTAHTTAVTAEKRRHLADDVNKRATYRRAHGLDMDEIFGWTSAEQTEKEALNAKAKEEGQESEVSSEGQVQQVRKRRPVKKWLGIWE